MAVWTITTRLEQVRLGYIESPLDQEPLVKPCGQGEQVLLGELTGWVCQQAQPFDMVRTPAGVFVRQLQTEEVN